MTEIQKLAFHLTHMHIIGMHHRVKERSKEFKHRSKEHDVLFFSDYVERIV